MNEIIEHQPAHTIVEAAKFGYHEQVSELIPTAKPEEIQDAFYYAVEQGFPEIAETLIAHGAVINDHIIDGLKFLGRNLINRSDKIPGYEALIKLLQTLQSN